METEKETKIYAAGKVCGYAMSTNIWRVAALMWTCLGAIVIMCFFPPWTEFYRDGNVKIIEPKGYYFIFDPPSPRRSSYSALGRYYGNPRPQDKRGVSIDFGRLALQCVPLLGIAVVMYLIQINDKKKKQKN